MKISDFTLPFEGKLSEGNRWMKLAAVMPWGIYAGKLKNEEGQKWESGRQNRSGIYCARHERRTRPTPVFW